MMDFPRNQKPVALFVIAKDFSIEAINQKLEQVYQSSLVPGQLTLVSGPKYPVFNPDGPTDGKSLQGTIPPIAKFSNTFSESTIDDLAEWLRDGPEWMFLERNNFAVLDDHSEPNDTITICRRNPVNSDGTFRDNGDIGPVEFYPHPAGGAGDAIRSILEMFFVFDIGLDGYRMRQEVSAEPDGPDLSRGTSYYQYAMPEEGSEDEAPEERWWLQ